MVPALAPKAISSGSQKTRMTVVSTTEMQTNAAQQLPRISSAILLSWRPIKMAARAAPPMPIRELKAVISVIIGKVTPTPVKAVAPITGI